MASRGAAGMLSPQLFFDGTEDKYDLWETRLLGHLHSLNLKETILHEPTNANEEQLAQDRRKNADCYVELIRLIDDKSLSLIRHDAADNGREALKILREHYSGKSKPRIISLYTSLTRLRMADNESVTDYIIRAEDIITALRNAGEIMSDGLIVAMVLGGLPDMFKPLAVHVTQNEDQVTFKDFKKRLRIYEEAEKMKTAESTDNVMKTHIKHNKQNMNKHFDNKRHEDVSVTCYRCGIKGHKARQCTRKVWCSYCRSNTHKESLCKKKGEQDGARKVAEKEQEDDDDHLFMAKHTKTERPADNIKKKGIMVDGGATSHIVNDVSKFVSFDETFQPETHAVELADGTKCNGIAQRRGTAVIHLLDSTGRQHRAQLRQALYMPSYPQDIFSVARAANGGATVTFKKENSHMITKDGSRFDIHESGNLYYLSTVEQSVDKCKVSHDIQTWHEIMGHCNYEDVQKLQGVVKGMVIEGSVVRPTKTCEVCTKGKFTQSRNREPDRKATKPLQLVHTDLAGPMRTPSIEGHRYAQSFTDDYSGTMFVYFLKAKSDAVHATERFLADIAPYGEVKCVRSDNGTEFTTKDFQELLTKNRIRHEKSAPYSPHQNGTAERGWRTLYEMGRCLLIESELPDELWNYAVQTAAYVRNRCYSKRTRKTPYEMFTGVKPDVSKMQKFGSTCFAYKQEKGKLDSRCQQGVFIGYDKNSPAYLVYYSDTERVQKHRLVKFTTKTANEKETQTPEANFEYCDGGVQPKSHDDGEMVDENEENTPTHDNDVSETAPKQTEVPQQGDDAERTRRNPKRERKKPTYLQDFETEEKGDKLQTCIDFCYRAVCDIPQTYKDAIASTNSRQWISAMNEEMQSLEENETFSLTHLPPGKRAVGGKWVYALKSDTDGSEKYKARYVAKGYSQKHGTDYEETFSPTADMTSVRVVMQKAAQENLVLHQMDVKTAYLHAPIDFELYIDQPEGYETWSDTGEKLVCKLHKSLYGLKQSGRNWNAMLHSYLIRNDFTQNPADHCVYTKEKHDEKVILIIWVDDLIIAASNESILTNVKTMLTEKFKMKDLGRLRRFLGIDFEQTEGQVVMSQKRYVNKILKRFEMQDCRARETPCEPKLDYSENAEKMTNSRKYREAVGSLIYLSTCTRPDISFVVSKLSQHFDDPTEEHWSTVKHVFRYLKGTAEQSLCFKRNDTSKLGLKVYSDADWASERADRHSISGYCVSLSEGSSLISWKSRKQPTVALSTCEAEYIALASAIQECIYLKQLLKGMDKYQYTQTKVYEDNQGTMALVKNPVNRQRCKHIDIKYHFIREVVNSGKVLLEYCPTDQMLADIMTKPATKLKLKRFVKDMFGT